MVREFPISEEMVSKEDLKGQLKQIISEDFYNGPFTLQDIAEELGSEVFHPNEKRKPDPSSGPEVSIKSTLSQMVKDGYLTYNEEDETYEVSEDARMRMGA